MATPELEKIYQLIDALGTTEKRALLQHLTEAFSDQPTDNAQWAEGEIEALLADYQPMTGEQIVAGGFTGGWEHREEIADGGEWISQRRVADKTTWQ